MYQQNPGDHTTKEESTPAWSDHSCSWDVEASVSAVHDFHKPPLVYLRKNVMLVVIMGKLTQEHCIISVLYHLALGSPKIRSNWNMAACALYPWLFTRPKTL